MKRKGALILFLYATVGLILGASASERLEIESLITQLGDEAVEVRHNASIRLAQIGAPAVPALVGVLPEADRKLALSIVETLTLMGSDAEAAVSALIEAFRKPNFSVYRREMFVEFHNSCIEALAAIGSPAVRPLVEALNDVNEYTRYHVASALGWLGSKAQEAVPALIQLLKDKDDGVRQAAASALGRMAQPTAVDIMLIPLEDLLPPRRKPALSQTNHPAQAAVPTLIEMLGDEDENDSVRVAAAGTLGSIGDVTAVPALITSLNDINDRVRSAAASALGKIGPPANAAVPTLINILKKGLYETQNVRVSIVLGLGGIGTPDALNALIDALSDESTFIRKEAVYELSRIGEPVDKIVPPLLEALADTDQGVRVTSSMELARIGEPAIPFLIEALSHEKVEVRKWSAFALSEIDGNIQAAEPALIQTLGDKDKDVRRYAAYALKRIGTPEAIKAAVPVLEKDDKPIISTRIKKQLKHRKPSGF